MNKALGLLLFVATLLMTACITSTTTGAVKPESSDKEAAQNYYQLGARYYRNGKFDFARNRLQRAVELDPKHAEAHSTLALTFIELDNPRLATEHFERSVRLAPANMNVRNNYAVYLCKQRLFAEAQIQFAKALENPENDDPEIMLTNAGVCVAQQPDLERAETYFRQALQHKPDYGEALLQLGILKRNQDNNLAARAFLQRFLSASAATPPVLYLALQIERDLQNEQASGEYALRLLRDFPKSVEAQFLRDGR